MNPVPWWLQLLFYAAYFGLGWMSCLIWTKKARRRRWTRIAKIELERQGLEVEKIHWSAEDLPAHIHIKHREGAHDAEG